jgi:diguanylate cyclase (GGDEF)-like protein
VAEQLGVLANEISDIGRELRQRNRELEEANRKITELSRTDPLTGLANRRRFLERLDPLLALAQRRDLPLCVAMADLDHFKRVNDTYGHEAGDEVLCAFAHLLRRECRREDLPCRFGGEEFVVLLPYTRADEGLVLAERIRSHFAATQLLDGKVTATASFGLAAVQPEDTAQTFIARADQALYQAKAKGRDCTVTA